MQTSEAKSNKISRYFSLFRVVFWAGMIPASYFFGWLGLVTFVALCSLYANLASDYAAWRSDVNPNQEQLDRIEAKLDQLLSQ